MKSLKNKLLIAGIRTAAVMGRRRPMLKPLNYSDSTDHGKIMKQTVRENLFGSSTKKKSS